MSAWLTRGLRRGVLTTRYPEDPEPGPPGFRGSVEPRGPSAGDPRLEALCPTGAILAEGGELRVDRGRCILCGACTAVAPELLSMSGHQETAGRSRAALVVPPAGPGVEERLPTLGERSRPLRRSIHIRHVDAGSDGAEEWEIQALTNPYYDMQRLGLFFTASPRHADILLVSGGVTRALREPLERTWDAMPAPRAVVAAGTDACSGGLAAGSRTVIGGVDRVLPVAVYVPGSPPSPIAILHGLLLAAGIVGGDGA